MKIAELFDVRGAATAIAGGASGIGLACAAATSSLPESVT
jgi:short-subunit dehydrogenase involved in D-alanine esterification of teichoic acids